MNPGSFSACRAADSSLCHRNRAGATFAGDAPASPDSEARKVQVKLSACRRMHRKVLSMGDRWPWNQIVCELLAFHDKLIMIFAGEFNMNECFKQCPCCNKTWQTQKDFVDDDNIVLVGYKADFEKLQFGLFFFNHKDNNCGSTITINTLEFENLYSGPKYVEKRTGMEGCPKYCKNQLELGRCDQLCECAYVREIASILAKEHK